MSVWQREVEEGMELCMRFMMVNGDMVSNEKSVEDDGYAAFAGSWRRALTLSHSGCIKL